MKPVLSYIDPSSGSLFLQVLIGGALSAGYVARNFIKRVFRSPGKPKTLPDKPSEE